MHKTYLGLGSNLGDRERNITKAIQLIEERIGEVVRKSSFYYSEPQGFVSEHDFVNAVVLCQTEHSAQEVLFITQDIERELGRTRKSVNGIHYDRIIDIDILLYDDLVINQPDLQIPHPRMQERDFVVVPLKEIQDI